MVKKFNYFFKEWKFAQRKNNLVGRVRSVVKSALMLILGCYGHVDLKIDNFHEVCGSERRIESLRNIGELV